MHARAIAVRPRRSRGTSQDGYAMAALLVAMSVMAVFMTIALPVWNTPGDGWGLYLGENGTPPSCTPVP